MKKLTHTIDIGRFEVTGQYEGVPIAHDGSLGMRSEELERLELQAAIAVFSQRDLVNGDELRFARKAMDQLQPALAELLDVSVGTVSRWENGAEPIGRQTQLAVLLLLAPSMPSCELAESQLRLAPAPRGESGSERLPASNRPHPVRLSFCGVGMAP